MKSRRREPAAGTRLAFRPDARPRLLYGVADAGRVLLEGDPQVTKALELIPEAKDLASKARRQLAEKR